MHAKPDRGRPAAKKRSGVPPAEAFPPLSISNPVWLADGSDRAFRRLIYELLSLSSLLLGSRERFAAYIGVSGPQYSMMVIVAERDAATVGQIADALRVSGPFVTTEVGKLERRGIVEKRRSEADGRSNVIALTELGRRLIEDLGPLRREINDMMYGSLDAAQVEQLVEIVSVLHRDATRALHMLDSPEHRGRVAPSATG